MEGTSIAPSTSSALIPNSMILGVSLNAVLSPPEWVGFELFFLRSRFRSPPIVFLINTHIIASHPLLVAWIAWSECA